VEGQEKRAAIDLDEIGQKRPSEISAEEFLAALNAGGLAPVQHLTLWPEKKKVELWTEPEGFGEIRLKDIFDVIRNEKKKRELELPDLIWERINPPWYDELLNRLTRDIETRLGSRALPQDPVPMREYDQLVDRLARDVEANLRRR
jgi:hypothetical protein